MIVYYLKDEVVGKENVTGNVQYVSTDASVLRVLPGNVIEAVGKGEATLKVKEEDASTVTTWSIDKKITVADGVHRVPLFWNRSPQDIAATYETLKPLYKGNAYTVKPITSAPYRAGILADGFLQDGLRMAKFVRYLAGLPADLTLDADLNEQAQHGAVLNAAWDELDHTPPRPSDMSETFYKRAYESTSTSNLSSGVETLDEQVIGFMDDLGLNNVETVGHRRWIMNPSLKKIGFGMAVSETDVPYGVMQVFDRSGGAIAKVEYDYLAWPAPGFFPLGFLAEQAVWSVSLNPQVYDRSQSAAIRVTMREEASGKAWTFDENHSELSEDERFFMVNTSNVGVPFAVLFRPEGVSFKQNQVYSVRVDGLVKMSGEVASISYFVRFFDLKSATGVTGGSGAGQPPTVTPTIPSVETSGGESVVLPNYPSSAEVARATGAKEIKIIMNGKQKVYDQPPFSENGRVLVPLRGVLENLGAKITFNSQLQMITAVKEGRTVMLFIGKNIAFIDGVQVSLDQPPLSKQGRVFVPLRFVGESFQANVVWQGKQNAVVISFAK
jgi:uncharacterized protein YkwD